KKLNKKLPINLGVFSFILVLLRENQKGNSKQ
ncbi:MAG: hypothetical protein ACI83H_002762, partial [Glaciecola sp.]